MIPFEHILLQYVCARQKDPLLLTSRSRHGLVWLRNEGGSHTHTHTHTEVCPRCFLCLICLCFIKWFAVHQIYCLESICSQGNAYLWSVARPTTPCPGTQYKCQVSSFVNANAQSDHLGSEIIVLSIKILSSSCGLTTSLFSSIKLYIHLKKWN